MGGQDLAEDLSGSVSIFTVARYTAPTIFEFPEVVLWVRYALGFNRWTGEE